MKNILALIIILIFLSCKTQENQNNYLKGIELSAYQPNQSVEKSTLYSMIHSSKMNEYSKLIFNGKERPFDEVSKIIDTIKVDDYFFDVKVDSSAKKKVLIITKRQ